MTAARCALVIAALVAASLSPAFGATHHETSYRSNGHWPRGPLRITVYPARRDYSYYIDPVSGMYCHNTGWATTCVPHYGGWRGLDCAPAWPFPVCARF
jgi:hypothetical protein